MVEFIEELFLWAFAFLSLFATSENKKAEAIALYFGFVIFSIAAVVH